METSHLNTTVTNAYIWFDYVRMQQALLVPGLPVWLFWSQILKFWLFEHLWLFLKIKKARENMACSGFFSGGKAWLWQNTEWATYSLEISSDESLWSYRVLRIWQIFCCCPKNHQCCWQETNVRHFNDGKENASKDWNWTISMFLKSFNINCLFDYACLCECALKLFLGFFWLFWDKVWVF